MLNWRFTVCVWLIIMIATCITAGGAVYRYLAPDPIGVQLEQQQSVIKIQSDQIKWYETTLKTKLAQYDLYISNHRKIDKQQSELNDLFLSKWSTEVKKHESTHR